MAKAISEETAKAIKGLYTSGMSAREVAETLGVNVTTVYRSLDRAGIEREKKSAVRLTDAQKVKIIELYRDGETLESICKQVGCSKPTLYRYINKTGLTRATDEQAVSKAIELYRDTLMPVAEICRKTGITKPTFYRWLRKLRE